MYPVTRELYRVVALFLFLSTAAQSQTPNVVLLSPNGFQSWEAGTQRRILFSTSDVSDIRIEYSRNNGVTWTEIVPSVPASNGSHLWTLPTAVSDQSLIRISSVGNPLIADTSDRPFSIITSRSGHELDYVFFSDSPTPVFYDPSWGFANPPSTVELVGTKFPVTTRYSLVGNYALRLNWNSQPSGDWGMAVAGLGWVGRDVTLKDSLIFHMFTETAIAQSDLPCMYLEDLSNRKTTKIPLSLLFNGFASGTWHRIAMPLRIFRDNPGQADLTRIKTIFFGQQQPDGAQQTWFLDDIRMTGGEGISGRRIVVLGSSTAAGIGPSVPDSAWVARYRRYIRSLDTTGNVVNLAVGGFTTYDVMPTGFVPPSGRPSPSAMNNITAALANRPSAIVVNLPSNDVAFGYSVAEQLANYDTLRSRSLSSNVPIWIGTSQPRNIADPVVRDRLRVVKDSILARYGSRAIDVWNGLANSDGTILPQFNQGDGIHLNDAGHRLIYERVVAANIWQTITSVIEPTGSIPEAWFSLLQNFPNPFNPETTIRFSIPASAVTGQVHSLLVLYDVLGREVATLVNELKPAGDYSVRFDARGIASGVYYYKLSAGGFTQTKKMILAK